MRLQSRIACLLIATLLAVLTTSGVPIAAIAADDVTTPTADVTAPAAPPAAELSEPAPAALPDVAPAALPDVAPAAFDADITIWSDSEPLDFGVNPAVEGAGTRTRRVNLSVTSSQPFALTLRTDGDFTIVSWPTYGVGQAIPPSIMSFARYGSSDWRPLSSSPTTVAEEPDVVGTETRNYSFVFEAYPGQDPGWDILAGGYEAPICFRAVPLGDAEPSPLGPADGPAIVDGGVIPGADRDPGALTDPAPVAPDALGPTVEPTAPAEGTTPTPLPIVELLGTVTATLTSNPETPTESLETTPVLALWLADTELVSASSTLTCGELGGYRLALTLDGVQVGELLPVVGTVLYVCQWDTSSVQAGEHLLEVMAKIGDEDPGFPCWSARVEVRLGSPAAPLPEAPPATVEASVTPQTTVLPDATDPEDAPDGGGGVG